MKSAEQRSGTNDTSCTVYAWGRGKDHVLGTGHAWMHPNPTAMMHVGLKVKSVACGARHTLLLSSHFKVFSWGESMHGQLGLGATSARQASVQPTHIDKLDSLYVVQVAAGGNCSLAISKKGTMLAWGDNSMEQLGLGASFSGKAKVLEPSSILGFSVEAEIQWQQPVIVRARIGGSHGACLDTSGNLFTWGRNDCGQLGLGDQVDRNTPSMVKTHQFVRVSVGTSHTAAVDHRYQLWTWGSVGEGRLGHGVLFEEKKEIRGNVVNKIRRQLNFVLEPKKVEFFKQKRIGLADVACSNSFTIALDRKGRLWSWGAGMYGQLGRGSDNLTSDFPELIEILLPDEPPDLFQQNLEHRRSLRRNSASFLFRNSFSLKSLASGTNDTDTPLESPDERKQRSFIMRHSSRKMTSEVQELRADSPEGKRLSFEADGLVDERVCISQLVVGKSHAFAVSKKGQLFFWGKGDFGLAGNGDSRCQHSPIAVPSMREDVSLVGTGDHFAIAVRYQDRKSLVSRGYRLLTLPNTQGIVHVLEEVDRARPEAKLKEEDKVDQRRAQDLNDASKQLTNNAYTSSKEWKNKYQSLVPGAEHFLELEGWDLLDGPYLDTSLPQDPALDLMTPGGIKSLWSQYKTAKKVEDPGRREVTGNRTDRRRSLEYVLLPPKPLHSSDRLPSTLKDAMAVETLSLYEEEHKELRQRERTRILSAHRRSSESQGPRTTFGTESRFKRRDPEEQDGKVTQIANDVGYVPAGIGLVLTANLRFDSVEKEVRVKEVVRGGSVHQSVLAEKSVLGVDDVIMEVDGRQVKDLFDCRRALMGQPGTSVSVTFMHRDKNGVSVVHTSFFPRMYVEGPRAADRGGHEEEAEANKTPRFYNSRSHKTPVALTEEQEREVVEVAQELPRGSLSLRALQRKLVDRHPAWREKVSDVLVLVGALKRNRLLPWVCASEASEAEKEREEREVLSARPDTARASSGAPTALGLRRSDTLESQEIVEKLQLGKLLRAGPTRRPLSMPRDKAVVPKTLVEGSARPSPGPADYAVTYGNIGSAKKGFTFTSRATEIVPGTPGPADYQQTGEKDGGPRGPTFQFRPRTALVRVDPPPPPPLLSDIVSTFDGKVSPHRRSVHGGAPSYSIASRKLWETQRHLEYGESFDALSSKWVRDGAGPGQYKLPASTGSAFSFPSSERFAEERGASINAELLFPGVCRDGTAAGVGGGLKFTMGGRYVRSEEDENMPGPGSYEVSPPERGGDKGPSMAARYPSSSSSSAAPGPGAYRPENFEAIGSELVAVGAASRMQEEKERKRVGEQRAQVNFSLANKLIDDLRRRLKKIFKSPEEAFAFLDEKEDQRVTFRSLRAQLESIKIKLDDDEMRLIAAKLDRNRDGIISVEEFLASFTWGVQVQTPRERLQKLVETCKRRIEIVKQIKQRMVERDFSTRRKLVVPSEPVTQRQDSKKKRKMHIFLRPAPPASARNDTKRGYSFRKQT